MFINVFQFNKDIMKSFNHNEYQLTERQKYTMFWAKNEKSIYNFWLFINWVNYNLFINSFSDFSIMVFDLHTTDFDFYQVLQQKKFQILIQNLMCRTP
jgi:hypothetical protein